MTEQRVTAPAAPPTGGRIGHTRLGAFEASGLSLAGLAPTMAMALGTAFAASEAGGAVPLSYLLGTIGAFALAYVFVKFVRRYDVASGVAFTYVGRAVGRIPGFTAGWLYVAAWVSSTAVVLAIGAVAISALLARNGTNISWWVFFVIQVVIVFGLNYIGVRPSVRLQVLLELGSMVVLSLVMIHVLIRGGAAGLSWKPFEASTSPKGWSGIGYGLIYGFSGYAGFEAAAALGRESRDPKHVIPRAMVFSLLGAAVFYLLVTYALSIGYGVAHSAAWAADPAPLDTIVGRYTGSTWAQTIDAMVAVSAFSSGLGLVTLSTRVLYDISGSGSAPRLFSRLHPRHETPYLGVFIVSAIALGLGLIVGLATNASELIGVLAGANTLGDIVVYLAVAAAALWAFRPYRTAGRVLVGVGVPAVAIVLLAFAFKTSIIPVPAFPYSLGPYLVLATIVIALLAGLWLRSRGREHTLRGFE